MSLKNRFRQRGDTLVEVLISMLVVSMILTGAYVTTNRSSIAVRDSQEHAEALKLVQGQLEQVRYNATQASAEVFTQSSAASFCMVSGAVVSATIQPGAAKCTQDGGGNPTTAQPAYKMTIKRADCSLAAGCNQFTIQATWESVTGRGNANEQIVYRLYK